MPGAILLAVDVEADAPTVFAALSTASGLRSFWTPDVDIEPVVGSVGRFGFSTAPVDLRMRVDALEPGRSVRWACLGDFPYWSGTRVAWELTPAPSGAMTVAFRQEGWPDDYPEIEYARVSYVWARILGALKAYVESGVAQPFLT